jgi:predicted transglutaminase-like cysteine proteinase
MDGGQGVLSHRARAGLRLALAGLLLVCGTSLSHRVQADYPWHDATFLANADGLSHWAATLTRHSDQRADLAACTRDHETCEKRLRGLTHLMNKASALTKEQQLRLVNRYINRKKYRRDRAIESTSSLNSEETVFRNTWSTLVEFTRNGGDCEDYATAKYFLLRELGFSAEELRIVVTFEPRTRGYHAVLAYRESPDRILLLDSDNTVRRIPAARSRYVYAVNELGIWDHET